MDPVASRRYDSSRKHWDTPFSIAHDHVRAQQEMAYSYSEVLVYILSFEPLHLYRAI